MATQRAVYCRTINGQSAEVLLDQVKQQNFWQGSIQTIYGWGKLLVSYNTVVGLWVNGEIYEETHSMTTSKQVSKYTGYYAGDNRRHRNFDSDTLSNKIAELTGFVINCKRGGAR